MTGSAWWMERRTVPPQEPRARAAADEATRRLSVAAAAAEAPDRPALVVAGSDDGTTRHEAYDEAWSWARLADAVATTAIPERAFALVGHRRLEVALRLYAAWQRGVPVVPLHPRWTTTERAAFVDALGLAAHDAQAPGARPPASIDPESILTVVATSGSSGTPRGVALSRRAVLAAADASAANLGWRPDDRWLVTLPLAHVGGLSILLRCLVGRACAVLPPPDARFDAAVARRWIERFEVTLLSLVPSMLQRLLEDDAPPPPSLRAVLVGGAPASASLLRSARARGWPVLATYGLSEACAQVATEPPTERRADGGVGPPLPGVSVEVDPDGVLAVGGATLMSGYVPSDAPGRGLETRDGVPWLRTGDLATVEAGGGRAEGGRTSDGRAAWLRILGRADAVLISGGENVQPQDVEAALVDHPGVAEVCVVGVDDARWGQRVTAVVVPDPSTEPITVDSLRRHLADRLAAFKHPRAVVVVDALPRLASGKVDRRAVAERARRPGGR